MKVFSLVGLETWPLKLPCRFALPEHYIERLVKADIWNRPLTEAEITELSQNSIANAGSSGPRIVPTDIQLSNASVVSNLPVGTFVGEFNATDPNADSHVFAFAEGEGSQDNNLFTLEADGTLKTNAILDHDANSTHTIRVRATQVLGEGEKMVVGMAYLPEETGERETEHKKDQWRYVAITKASDLSGSVFVDGKKLYGGTFKNHNYLYVRLYLGASFYTSFTGYFRGMIDEFRLSNKVRTAAN